MRNRVLSGERGTEHLSQNCVATDTRVAYLSSHRKSRAGRVVKVTYSSFLGGECFSGSPKQDVKPHSQYGNTMRMRNSQVNTRKGKMTSR